MKKYGHLNGEPILFRLKDIPPNGLGFSLGTGLMGSDKNYFHKEENPITETETIDSLRKRIIAVNITSSTILPLQDGDELLEVNSFLKN